jgi:hypothetical protein
MITVPPNAHESESRLAQHWQRTSGPMGCSASLYLWKWTQFAAVRAVVTVLKERPEHSTRRGSIGVFIVRIS